MTRWFVLASSLLFTLAACSSDEEPDTNTDPNATTSSSSGGASSGGASSGASGSSGSSSSSSSSGGSSSGGSSSGGSSSGGSSSGEPPSACAELQSVYPAVTLTGVGNETPRGNGGTLVPGVYRLTEVIASNASAAQQTWQLNGTLTINDDGTMERAYGVQLDGAPSLVHRAEIGTFNAFGASVASALTCEEGTSPFPQPFAGNYGATAQEIRLYHIPTQAFLPITWIQYVYTRQ